MDIVRRSDDDDELLLMRRHGIGRGFPAETAKYGRNQRHHLRKSRICTACIMAQLPVSAVWNGDQRLLDTDVYEYDRRAD